MAGRASTRPAAGGRLEHDRHDGSAPPRTGSYDFVHLSNILDWLSPEEARATLDVAHAALRPGGWVLIRQLNSTLDIPCFG